MGEHIYNTCSGLFRSADISLMGTATQGNPYLFLPVPIGRWGRTGFSEYWKSEDATALHDSFVAQGGRVRLYDSDRKTAFFFGDKLVREARRLLSSVGISDLECPKDNMIFVCTHGKRDRCCALWGQKIVKKLRSFATAHGWRVYRCSHLGGDRFAATAITFPSGSMYGSLSEETIEAVLTSETVGKIASGWYRGCVFESKYLQLARFALAQSKICSTSDADVEIISQDEAKNNLVLSVTLHSNMRATIVFECEQVELATDCRSLEGGMLRLFPAWKLTAVNLHAP